MSQCTSQQTGQTCSEGSSNLPAIVGATIGGIVVLLLAVAVAFYLHRRRRAQIIAESQAECSQPSACFHFSYVVPIYDGYIL